MLLKISIPDPINSNAIIIAPIIKYKEIIGNGPSFGQLLSKIIKNPIHIMKVSIPSHKYYQSSCVKKLNFIR